MQGSEPGLEFDREAAPLPRATAERRSVRRFFRGRNVLLTGATGFLGLNLLEKLLRDLPEAGRIHLLVRESSERNRTAADRLEHDIRNSSVFDRLRREWGPAFRSRFHEHVTVVAGDLGKPRLGLDASGWRTLARDVNLVMSSAATVVFDERLDVALQVNALGPAQLLDLAEAAGAPLVHVSTAYVSGRAGGAVREVIAPPISRGPGEDIDATEEVRQIEALCAELRDDAAPGEDDASLGRRLQDAGMARARRLGWNDTYTYTKWLGEQLLHRRRGRVAMTIVRPSIIESSLEEPEPGWIDGLRMTDPLIIGMGKGRLRDFPGRPEIVLDLVPVDLVTRATLSAAAWTGDAAKRFEVMHVATSTRNPLRLGQLYETLLAYYDEFPFHDRHGAPLRASRVSWPPLETLRRRYERELQLLRRREARSGGTASESARARRQRSELERLVYYLEIYAPYAHLDCRFAADHTREIDDRLPEDERTAFGCGAEDIDWERYIREVHVPGLRRFVLRQDRDRPQPARRPLRRRLLQTEASDAALLREAVQPSTPKRFLQRTSDALSGIMLSRYLHLETEGLEHLPADGPCLVAANHASHLDTAAIRFVFGRRAHRLHVLAAREYFFDRRLKGWFFSTLFNTLPLDRARARLQGLALCRELVSHDHSVLVYPEGTRSPSGDLQEFKVGAGVLALELDCPVVPLRLSGSFESMPRGRRLPRPGRLRLQVGPALDLDDLRRRLGRPEERRGARLYREAARRLQDAVATMD